MKLAQDRKKKFSLALQYTATMTALLLVGMGLLAATMLYSQFEQNDRSIRDFGEIITTQLASNSIEPIMAKSQVDLQALVDLFSTDKHIVGVGIFNQDQHRLAYTGELPVQDDLHFDQTYYRLGDSLTYEYLFLNQHIVHIQPIQYREVIAGYAVVVFSQEYFDKQMERQVWIMIILFVTILILAIFISFFLGRRLSSPIRNLVNAAESIRTGKQDIIFERRNDELGTLIDAINTMSQGLIRKNQVESMLDRVLTSDIKHKVMDQLDTVQMAGEHVDATVLFADIVGFTSISEQISPEEVQKLLNEYYGYFNACARFYFGTVDKYIGDCVMVVFGAAKEDPKHHYNSIACAILMQKLANQLNVRREEQGLYPIDLRIGINSGKMMAGLIGSKDRMEYTVVGDAVNLASRLCSEADGSQIIIEESLYEVVNPEHPMTVEAHKEIFVRGKKEPVTIYSVVDIEQQYQVVMDDLIEDILSRASG